MRVNPPIRVLLVDDHAMVREGVRAWLSRDERVKVVGEACDGIEAIQQAGALQPDVILLDMSMPRMGGLEAALRLRADAPKAALLALTVPGTQEQVQELLRLGAMGYLLKGCSPDELICAIWSLANGEAYIGLEAAKLILDETENEGRTGFDTTLALLTPREVEVLTLVAEAHSSSRIAEKLQISPRTVEKHRQRLMRKLKIPSSAGLVRYAISAGLIRGK